MTNKALEEKLYLRVYFVGVEWSWNEFIACNKPLQPLYVSTKEYCECISNAHVSFLGIVLIPSYAEGSLATAAEPSWTPKLCIHCCALRPPFVSQENTSCRQQVTPNTFSLTDGLLGESALDCSLIRNSGCSHSHSNIRDVMCGKEAE